MTDYRTVTVLRDTKTGKHFTHQPPEHARFTFEIAAFLGCAHPLPGREIVLPPEHGKIGHVGYRIQHVDHQLRYLYAQRVRSTPLT